MAKMIINSDKIQEYLPHRYPFIFIDRVLEFEVSKYIVGQKNITINEQIFQGHFQDKAVFPGVLQIEAIAQLASVFWSLTTGSLSAGHLPMLAGVDKVRFRKQIIPGDVMILRLEVQNMRSNLARFQGTIFIDDEIATSALITCASAK